MNPLIQAYKKPGTFAHMLGIAVLYYFAARWSLTLAFEGSSASPIWPPSGIALAAVFMLRFRAVPAIIAGAFTANLMQFYLGDAGINQASLLISLSIALGNTLESVSAVYLTRRWLNKEDPFAQPLNIFKFTIVILLACSIAATIGSFSLLLGKFIPGAILFRVWLNWWLGDIAGIVVLTPLLLAWLPFKKLELSALKLAENLFTAILVLIVSWLIFSERFSADHLDRLLVYLAILTLAWVAYRYRLRGVTLSIVALVSAAIYATINGLGPFYNGNLNDSLILLVSFITMFSLTGLLLNSDLTNRSSLTEGAQSNQPNLAWFTLVGLLGLTILTWHLTALDTEKTAKKQFNDATRQIALQLKQGMQIYEEILQGGVALFAASNEVTREEWHNYYQQLDFQGKLPNVLGFGFADYIKNSEKSDFIAGLEKETGQAFTVTPSGERDFYTVTRYLEPHSLRNTQTIGFDMYSESMRRAALQAAISTGTSKITGRITLQNEPDVKKQPGIQMYLPVYRKNAQTNTPAQRQQAILGFVFAPFRIAEMMGGMLGSQLQQIGLTIFDGDLDMLYSSQAASGQKASNPMFSEFSQVKIADSDWHLNFVSLPAFENSVDHQKAQLVLLAGFLISILLFIMVRALTVSKETAQALAKHMSSALKDSKARFRSLAESANEAILVTDAKGFIVSWNQAAFNIFGYADAQIINQHLSKIFPDNPTFLSNTYSAADTTPDKVEVIAKTMDSIGVSRTGKRFPVEISFSTWLSDEGRYYSAIIRDITARKTAELELQASEKRFRSMMEHAPIGMALVSLTGQWMKINQGISDIVGYSPEELIKMTFQEITHEDDLANDLGHLAQLISNEINSYQIEKRYVHKNGSLVWVMLSVSLMRDEQYKPLYFISQIENINAQKLAQIQLNETLAFQSAILASADQLIVATDTKGIIKGFNQAAEFKLGYMAAEVIDQHTPTRFHLQTEIIQRAHDLTQEYGVEVKPGFDVFIMKTKFGEKDENEWVYRRKDGSTFPVILSVTAIINAESVITGYLGVASDITERKLSEQALLAEGKYLASVIEGTHAGTWQWNVATGECQFNERWASMLGYQQEELGNQMYETWSRLTHPDDIEAATIALNQHFNGEADMYETEFRMQHKAGNWVWIQSRGRVLNWTDDLKPMWMYGTHIDVTERKRVDLELRQAYSNLEEFTAIASHDLKTPLRGIADLSEWIEEDLGENIGDNIKHNLNRIKIRVRRMDALITELLQYARASVAVDEQSLLDPVAMVHDILDLLSIPDSFHTVVSGTMAPFTTAATPLKTIVRNLISNAVKHHDRPAGNIEIKLYSENNLNMFEIRDDGPGIPKAAQERVFKLFQTLSKSESSTGVGLAVSKRMAEAHGGKIDLESSTEERRTVFTVIWPAN